MANRYLSQMDVFSRRMLKDLSDLLLTESEKVTAGQLKTLEENTNKIQKRHGIIQERRARFEAEIDRYVQSSMGEDNSEDVKASMLNILMERYAKRIPQRSLFENQGDDPDPSRPLTADGGIADGARIHLLHKFNRPYYFGIDSICDASSENAEQFLQLASRLVSRSETQLVRAKPPSLSSSVQNKLIREQATEMVQQWDFPQCIYVRRIAEWIGKLCVRKSLEPNAPLGSGAIAIGILQTDFDDIPERYPNLASVLQYGIAYNAFTLVPNHKTKKRLWCLIELGGILLVHYGLSLKRGGFVEQRISDLTKLLDKE